MPQKKIARQQDNTSEMKGRAADGRGKWERTDTAQFWRLSARDKRTGHVILECFKLRQTGHPYKVDKLMPVINDFNDQFLTQYIHKTHGAGGYRLHHFNKEKGYSTWDIVIQGGQGETAGGLAEIGGREHSEKRIRELENQNLELQKQMIMLSNETRLTNVKILAEQTKIELDKRRAELEIKQLERDMAEGEKPSMLDMAMEAVKDPNNPIGKMLLQALTKYAGSNGGSPAAPVKK